MLVLALAFSLLFTPKTMRLDYFHTGDHGREIVALDRIVSDGPWAGSTTRLLDDLNRGTYFFAVVDPDTNRALIKKGAQEAEFDALFREQQASDAPMLSGMTYAGKVGAFERSAYQAKGLYRPQTDCLMFTRDDVGFCKVCRKAIERVIDLYAAPSKGGSSTDRGI